VLAAWVAAGAEVSLALATESSRRQVIIHFVYGIVYVIIYVIITSQGVRAASSGTHTRGCGEQASRLALSGAPVCGSQKVPEGSRRDTGGGLRDVLLSESEMYIYIFFGLTPEEDPAAAGIERFFSLKGPREENNVRASFIITV